MTTAARGHRPRLQLEDLRAAAHRELLAEVARKFGEIRFKATGDSMLPSVWPGDLLTVRRQSFSEFQSGEIVLYEREAGENTLTRPYGPASPKGRGFVAHRIVGRNGRQLITRGDSLRRNDAPVHEEQVLGGWCALPGMDATSAWSLRGGGGSRRGSDRKSTRLNSSHGYI